MAHRIRLALTLLALVVAAMAVAAALVPYMVDTDAARRTVSRWLADGLGREVVISGPMRFTLLPSVGFVVEELAVAGPDGSTEPPALAVHQASVTVALLPLLQRRIVVKRIHLKSPRAELVRDASGRTNWDLDAEKQTGPGLAAGARGVGLLSAFPQVRIEDGTLTVSDAVSGNEFHFTRIGLQRRGQDRRRFEIETHVECRQSPVSGLNGIGAQLHLAGLAAFSAPENRYTVEDARLDLTLHRPQGKTSPLARLEAMVSADTAESRLGLDQLRIACDGGALTGALTGRWKDGQPSLDVRVHVQIDALDALLTSMGLGLPPAKQWTLPRSAALDLDLSATPAKLAITGLQGRIDETALQGDLAFGAGHPASCQAKLKTGAVDLNAYLPAVQDDGSMMPTLSVPGLSLDLDWEAEALVRGRYRIDAPHFVMRLAPAQGVRIESVTGRFAGGDWCIGGQIDARDDALSGAMTLAARNVALPELWPAGREPVFSRGRVDIEAELTAAGAAWKDLPDGIHGRVRLSTRRPLQRADALQSKVEGHLEAKITDRSLLTVTSDLQWRKPDLKIALQTEGRWDPQNLTLESERTSLGLGAALLPGPDRQVRLEGPLSLSFARRTVSWNMASRFAGGDWRLDGSLEAGDQGVSGAMTAAGRDVDLPQLWPAGREPFFKQGKVDLDAQLTATQAPWKDLHRSIFGRVRVATGRPVQWSDAVQKRVEGYLEAALTAQRRLSLVADLRCHEPDLDLDLNTEGAWDPQTLALESERATLEIATPLLPGPDSRIRLAGPLILSVARRKASWNAAKLSAPGLNAGGSMEMAHVDGRPVIDARLEVLPVDLQPWFQAFGIALPQAAQPESRDQAAGKAHLHYDGQRIAIRDLELTVDETRLRGVVDVSSFKPFQMHFMLDADRIDLDRYLDAGDATKDSTPTKTRTESGDAPVAIDGTLTAGQVRVFDLDANDVFAKVAVDRAALRLDPVSLTLYGGKTEGRMRIALDGSDPVWKAGAAVQGAQLRQPLEIIFKKPVLAGSADIRADLFQRRTGGGKTVAGFNGQVDVTVRNGRIIGVQIVPDAIANPEAAPAAKPSASSSPPVQPFDTIEGRWVFTDGVAVAETHHLTGQHLHLESSGRVDFVQERLDATLAADISGIPLIYYYALNGPFGDIRVTMDRSRLVLDTTTGIVTSPLKLGKETLGAGADILERGGEVIGDDSGVQQMGKGAVTVGKGVLEVGKGVLELHRGGDSLGQGAKSVGEGVYGMGKGVVGVGKDVLDVGIKAFEGFGKGLERLFGGKAGESRSDSAAEAEAP